MKPNSGNGQDAEPKVELASESSTGIMRSYEPWPWRVAEEANLASEAPCGDEADCAEALMRYYNGSWAH